MIKFFSNIFGYILNYIYMFIGNYGIAIILFSVLLKLLLLPLSIKQQKNMKKTEKIQKELAVIKEKNKNNPEVLNKEMVELYKRENMSPFSGCLSSIVQIILILSMFLLIRNPLTYMYKIPAQELDIISKQIKNEEKEISNTYPEISILKYVNNNENGTIKEDDKEINLEKIKTNMNFLGVDLSEIPQQNYNDLKVYIIPVLYVISSIVSIKIMSMKKNNVKKEETEENKEEEIDMMSQMSRSMNITMPILAVSISLVAPLGLALYWLTNNVLVIAERIFIEKLLQKKGEI